MDLDEFVWESDRRGGPHTPDCTAYWMHWIYKPKVRVNQELDPRSDEYCRQQVALYEEMSGRRFDQYANELTEFDLERHVAGPNAYDHPDPRILAHQIAQLGHVFRRVPMVRGQHLLDMGCGWGLSSEFAATVGLTVTAVDINPKFVELVRRRAERLGLPIHAVMGSFDDVALPASYDHVLFYECLHHAYKPWELIKKLADRLSPNGRFLIVGEPLISDWKHWGMRLDPLSAYCIRKYGWYETGWSLEFLCSLFEQLGMGVEVDQGGDVGQYGVNFIAGFGVPKRVSVAAPLPPRPWKTRFLSAFAGR